MRTIICRPDAFASVAIEGVLRRCDFSCGSVKHLGTVVDERTPGVVHSASQAARQPSLKAGLQRVINRTAGIGTLTNDAARGIYARASRRSTSCDRVGLLALEQSRSLG